MLRVLKQLQKVLTADDATMPAAFIKAKAWDAGQVSVSTEDLRRAFARRLGLRMLLDLNQLKKTIRNGVSQGVWVYYDAAEGAGYSAASPAPAVQISDEAVLYTPEEARHVGLKIKGEEVVAVEATCPVCGNPISKCTCGQLPPPAGKEPIRLHAEGAPGQAFQKLEDMCADQHVASISRLTIIIEGHSRDGAQEARALGLAIPQLGKGEFYLKQKFNAEFGGNESLSLIFDGGWDRYKRLKQVTDGFGQEAAKLNVQTTLDITFAGGLSVPSDQLQTMREVFGTLGFGRMVLDAKPTEERIP